MITFAAQHYALSHPNLRFAVADARKLPYSHEFDQIVSFNALHWIPEQSAAIRSIHAALKPAGKGVT
jgi:trans-aconitate 2-methyltransferase